VLPARAADDAGPSVALTLHRGFAAQDATEAQKVLAAEENPNAAYGRGDEPLIFLAVRSGDLDLVKRTLAAGGRLDWNQRGEHFHNNLVDAAAWTSPEVMAFAWTRGLSVRSADERGTPLGISVARYGRPDTLAWLLDHGLKLEPEPNGWSLLFEAAESLAVENVEILLERGANATKVRTGEHRASRLRSPGTKAEQRDVKRILEVLRAAGDIAWKGPGMPPQSAPPGKAQQDVTRNVFGALPFIDPMLRFFIVYPPPPKRSAAPTAPQVPDELYAVRPDETAVLLDGPEAFHQLGLRITTPDDAIRLALAFGGPWRLTWSGNAPVWKELPFHEVPAFTAPRTCWRVTATAGALGLQSAPVARTVPGGFEVKRWVLLKEFNAGAVVGDIPAVGRVTDIVTPDGQWSYTLERVPSPGLRITNHCREL
jgi:hypothetical protein